jgi:uncharacterized protein (DUF983 family)
LPRIKNILFGLCPRCAAARVVHFLGRTDAACSSCGLDLKQSEHADGPAVFLIFILGFGIVPPALITAMNTDWPLWVHAFLWGGVVLAGVCALLMPSKALLLHIQYKNRPHDF